MAEVLLREKPNVLQFATTQDTAAAWWTHRVVGLPYIIYAHGNDILSAMNSTWAKPRQVLMGAATVIANSKYTAKLVEGIGVEPQKLAIVSPGCDIERFRPLEVDKETRISLLGQRWRDRIILTVGGLVERKGHDIAIMALKQILAKIPNVSYLIVGDGPCRQELQCLAEEHGIAEHVIFAGRVSDHHLPLYYGLCDIFLMPSRVRLEQNDVEGFGMVFLEAGACGKPSVGGRSGGVEDAVLDNQTGLLVDPGNPNQVASALELLLCKTDLARRLGSQARQHVSDQHTWRQVGNRVADIVATVGRSTCKKARIC